MWKIAQIFWSRYHGWSVGKRAAGSRRQRMRTFPL